MEQKTLKQIKWVALFSCVLTLSVFFIFRLVGSSGSDVAGGGNEVLEEVHEAGATAEHVNVGSDGVPGLRGQQRDGVRKEEPGIRIADILEAAGDLADPDVRAAAVAAIREVEDARREEAVRRAREAGLPLRVEFEDGRVKELAAWEEGRPVYFITHNVNAAISTAADLLDTAPYLLDGQGITIGMWDGGSGRASHQEFGGRLTVMDGSASIDHATHVGGTMIAAGVDSRARGMAVAARIDSYDWNNDKSEMTARGAAAPGEVGRLFLSNHSYGYAAGWLRTGGSNPAYIWYGSGTTASAIEPAFGRYNTFARDSDAIAHAAPYYLMVRSAGNERNDNPSAGQVVRLSPSSSETVSYDPALHPPGDGVYRGGYDTISFDALAKNVLTVGAVNDAVTGGLRDISRATMSTFSSWGPTDDGRIKPDVVGNGVTLFSSTNGSNSSYGTLSGTSMSAPNVTGTAAQLIQEYGRLFPGQAMRSSTLRALLIHTADDLGNPGPDYRFGWGLVNGKAAADFLQDHHAYPEKVKLTEETITPANPSQSYEFVWDGASPIRATLAWTDPAGTATTTSDLRSPRLRNNLDLVVIGPDNTVYHPYVMPFVGTWTQASMSASATTGVNNTDNVEQVYLAAPPQEGVYRAVVTYQGTLANNQQVYSLLISGSAAEEPPPPPLTLTGITPSSGFASGTLVVELEGTALATATEVKLTRDGLSDLVAGGLEPLGSTQLRATLPLEGAAAGAWDVVVSNEAETAVLEGAFTVAGAIYVETFANGAAGGWSSNANIGSNQWVLTDADSHTPTHSFFASGPASRSTANLVSPVVAIPEGVEDMQLRFWHRYQFEAGWDGGRLEFSVNGGSWFDVEDTGSGTAFASNGYNTTMRSTGNRPDQNEFRDQRAWSGNSGGWVETVVNFTDNAKFAGGTLRMRWRLATNDRNASPGWYVDTISLTGGGDIGNQPPVLVSGPTTDSEEVDKDRDGVAADIHVVRAASVGVSVEAVDDGGEEALTYTWSAESDGGAPVFFQPNGNNAASQSTAVFEAPGEYTVIVVVRNEGGLASSGSVQVSVIATATGIEVSPANTSLVFGEGRQFEARVMDQFGGEMSQQPSSFDWVAGGGGSIDAGGFFQSTAAGGPFAVTASSGGLSGSASVTINPAPAQVQLSNLVQEADGSEKSVDVTTEPGGLAIVVTYDGNGDLPVEPGSYAVLAVVTDPNYQGSAEGTFVLESGEPDLDQVIREWAESFGLEGDDADPDADPDGDGMSNRLEWRFGFNPSDPNSRLQGAISFQPGGTVPQLTINRVVSDGVFRILASVDMSEESWESVLEFGVEEDGDNHVIALPKPTPERGFYRVEYLP